MKACPHCGCSNLDDARYCSTCGLLINNVGPSNFNNAYQQNPYAYNKANDSTSAWWVLGLFIPIVGLILFLVWKDEYPKRAKSAGIGALISVGINVVIGILYFILIIVAIAIGITFG